MPDHNDVTPAINVGDRHPILHRISLYYPILMARYTLLLRSLFRKWLVDHTLRISTQGLSSPIMDTCLAFFQTHRLASNQQMQRDLTQRFCGGTGGTGCWYTKWPNHPTLPGSWYLIIEDAIHPPRFNVVSENRPSQKEPSLPTIIFEGYVKLRGRTPIKSTPTRNKGLWKGLLATIVLIWDDMGGFENLPQICSAIFAVTLFVGK